MTASARPFVVAHGAGNDLDHLRVAESLAVRVVEADVRLFRGRAEVRHLKRFGPLPIFWDRWRLAGPSARRLGLPGLLAAVGSSTTLMLDLKGRDLLLSLLVIEALAAQPVGDSYVSARQWALLEPFREVPGVRIVYSVGTRAQLKKLLQLDRPLDGVSIHGRLLDGDTVVALRAHAGLVMSWPVNGHERARQSIGWGVHGLISDEPAVVQRFVTELRSA